MVDIMAKHTLQLQKRQHLMPRDIAAVHHASYCNIMEASKTTLEGQREEVTTQQSQK